MERIKIAQIVNAVSLKGEVKVFSYSDPGRFEELSEISTEKGTYKIEKVRYQKNMVILKLSGVDDRNAAEALKGSNIYVNESDLKELPEDVYYIRDLIGLEVITDQGEKIGSLTDVIQNTSQDLYEVKRASGKILLIPAVKEFILETDLEAGFIRVKLIEGMLDL